MPDSTTTPDRAILGGHVRQTNFPAPLRQAQVPPHHPGRGHSRRAGSVASAGEAGRHEPFRVDQGSGTGTSSARKVDRSVDFHTDKLDADIRVSYGICMNTANSITVRGKTFTITETTGIRGDKRYLLTGKRGAVYGTCRNANRPDMMFLVDERGFGIPAGFERTWLTDATGELVVAR